MGARQDIFLARVGRWTLAQVRLAEAVVRNEIFFFCVLRELFPPNAYVYLEETGSDWTKQSSTLGFMYWSQSLLQ